MIIISSYLKLWSLNTLFIVMLSIQVIGRKKHKKNLKILHFKENLFVWFNALEPKREKAQTYLPKTKKLLNKF